MPGVDRTLFIYYDTAEVWKAIAGVAAIIVLPRNRLLKLIVVTSLQLPIFALATLTVFIALMVWGFMSYEPARKLQSTISAPSACTNVLSRASTFWLPSSSCRSPQASRL